MHCRTNGQQRSLLHTYTYCPRYRLYESFFMSKLLLSIWLFVASISTYAELLSPESTQVNLLSSAEFLEDPSGTLSLEDVRGMDQSFRAWTRGGTELNFGITPSAYWIRVPLQRREAAPKDWLLVVNYVKISELDFYPPTGAPIHTGSNRALSTRPYFDRFFVLPLEVKTQSSAIYLRVTSRYSLTVPMTLWQPDSYRKQQQHFQSLQFMYYGGLIVLALFGLAIFLTLKDTRFLIYCAYIVTTGIGVFASNGFGRQLLWPDAIAFDEISQSMFLSLGAFFVVWLARKLVLLSTERSWLTKGMQLSQSLFLLTCLLSVLQIAFPVFLRPANQLLMLNSLAMGGLITVASIRAYLQRRQGIRFFLAGWLVLWVGTSIAALRMFGWIPSNGFTSYAVQLSTVVEMLLMALALGELLRIEHLAYEDAQKQILIANQALLENTRTSEENLKRAVSERTEQLETSLKTEKSLREQYVSFGSMISHEFRTPLSVIQSQASLMRKEHERGIEQIAKRLGAISSAAQRLTVMFDKWLYSNDAITQTLEMLELKSLELQPWLQTLINTNSHLFLNHPVTLLLPPQVNRVLADEYHLGVVMTNLIDNAAKYSPINSAITIETLLKDDLVGIVVKDEGIGIPLEAQDKVFDAFFRVAPENSIRGVGLGLAIVQRIAHAHGGYVELSAIPEHGSTFCVWLPMAHPKEKK